MDSPDHTWTWQSGVSEERGEDSGPPQPDFLLDTPSSDRPLLEPVFTQRDAPLTQPMQVDEVWRLDELLASLAAIAPIPKPKPEGPSPLLAAVGLHMEGKLDEALGELDRGLAAGWDGADIHVARSQLLYELNRFAEALAGYEEVERLDPDRPGGAFHRGVCLERLGRHDEALNTFIEALRRNPGDREARRAQAIVHLQLGQYPEALKTFESCIASGADDPALLFGKGLALQYLGRPREAESVYREFLKKQPNCDDALVNMIVLSLEGRQEESVLRYSGLLLKSRADSGPALETLAEIELAAENYEAAASLCSRVVQRAPHSYEGWFNLGVACHATQQLEEAIEAFAEAARIRPQSLEAHLALGAAHQAAERFAEAGQDYEAAIGLEAGNAYALLNLAIVEERSGRTDAAGMRYADYVKRFPESEEAWYRLGQLRFDRSDYAGALECFEACLNLSPHWPCAQYNLALAAWKTGSPERAQQLLRNVLESQPNFQDAIAAMAQIALQQNHAPRASELLRSLIQLGDRSADTFFNLGLLVQNDGQWDEAITLYREALKERPNMPEALERLGQIHLRLGLADEARTYFRRAREANLELLERQQKAV